ncbi:MAG: hypothetical protein ACI9A1_000678 [Lentimonas sp.]|jgi:hypothetical protein
MAELTGQPIPEQNEGISLRELVLLLQAPGKWLNGCGLFL